MHDRLDGRQLVKTLVGDYKAGETPVPIPNTEVKLRLPMILLSGKVGNRRLHGPAKGNLGRATFVFAQRDPVQTHASRFPERRGWSGDSSKLSTR